MSLSLNLLKKSAGEFLRKRKKWLIALSIFIGFLIGLDIAINHYVDKVVGNLIKEFVHEKSNGFYKVEFDEISYLLHNGRFLLRDFSFDIHPDLKDTINKIKQRQRFRPFAPAILEEFADEYFEGPMNEYMQFVSKAKHDYKSVTHVDGTARVQVVKKNCKSIIRPILEEWYEQTGCPMLLNTSLNIKGQPMVDTWQHALDFEKEYDVKVF